MNREAAKNAKRILYLSLGVLGVLGVLAAIFLDLCALRVCGES
jgi:hypothetical protein